MVSEQLKRNNFNLGTCVSASLSAGSIAINDAVYDTLLVQFAGPLTKEWAFKKSTSKVILAYSENGGKTRRR
jgi:hypothetical protein